MDQGKYSLICLLFISNLVIYSIISWPNNGEIDVLEGVDNQATNAMTLHTSSGCNFKNIPQNFTGHWATGKYGQPVMLIFIKLYRIFYIIYLRYILRPLIVMLKLVINMLIKDVELNHHHIQVMVVD